jgi:hypothetical protein
MTGKIVRFGFAAGLATAVAVPLFADGAYAKGKPATVTLACDSGASGSGTVQLLSSLLGGSSAAASNVVTISCMSGQTSKVAIHPSSQPAPFYTYLIGVSNSIGSGSCSAAGQRPDTRPLCTPTDGGPGWTLTIS